MAFKFKGKKGNAIIEIMTFVILIFVLSLVWLSINYMQKELNTDIQNDADLRAENKQINQDLTDRYPQVFDALVLFFLILFWAAVLISSYMIDTQPAFFIFSFILLIFVFIVVILLGNTFEEIFTEDLTGLTATWPYTFFIFNNILVISIVMGISILLVMYAKLR